MKCHGNHSLFYKTRKETRKLQNITKLNTPCPMFYEQIGLLVTRKAQNGCKWSSSVQFICSVMSNSLGPHGLQHARLPCPSPTPRAYSNSCQLSQCRPFPLLPSIFPSIRDFSNESVLCIRWPKYCSFSFSISPSNEYSGLISFRID